MAASRDALRAARAGDSGGAAEVEIHLPEEVPWLVHRVATSRRYSDSLHTILTQWSVLDVFEANLVLDAIEDAEARARALADEED